MEVKAIEEIEKNKKLDLSYFVNNEYNELTLGLYDGLRISIKCWGNERATTRILALHGWLDNADSFATLAPLLTSSHKHDVRIVAMDFSGHGKSSHRPMTCSYTIAEFVVEVIEVADALNWNTFILMGHSMGAGVATIVAGTIPSRIEKLILLDGLGPWPANQTAPERLESSIKQRNKLLRRQRRVYPSFQAAVDRYMTNARITKMGAEQIVRRSTEEVIIGGEAEGNEKGIAFTHDPRLTGLSFYSYTEEQVTQFLQRISCPIFTVLAKKSWERGENFRSFFQKRWQLLKNAKMIVADGEHHVHLDSPELIYPQLLEFIGNKGTTIQSKL